jgi:hypothetical protein
MATLRLPGSPLPRKDDRSSTHRPADGNVEWNYSYSSLPQAAYPR